MPRSAQATRERILKSAYVQFRRQGFTRIGVDEIAAAAKITKRTLYYHFRSKDDLLAAVLEAQHEMALQAFRTFGDGLAGSPEEIVGALFSQLSAWMAKPYWNGSGFTRLAMELADMPGHPARKIAKRHKAILESNLADILARAGVDAPRERAREVWLLSEGAISLVLINGDRSYAVAAGEAARRLIATARPRTSPRLRH
ncbi:MAG: TetR/AcrR family transcriptional regulator [Bradyrhizobiaceae bacterium]|nr:TetR/AcrR family transcriptional regulator [Bradyrhizobiaceae bacterium]